MADQQAFESFETLHAKAQAYDRIVEKYRELRGKAEFYSTNWVELAELIEAEQRNIQRVE